MLVRLWVGSYSMIKGKQYESKIGQRVEEIHGQCSMFLDFTMPYNKWSD